MGSPLILLVAVATCALARSPSEAVTPVEVTIYYETLCPDCQHFIPKQLLPTYTDTKYDHVSLVSKLTMVPYGWVQVINATAHEYKCQHGQTECDGNRLHSCAVKYVTDQLTIVNYIACLENQVPHNPPQHVASYKYPIDKCQNKLPPGMYTKIIDCYNSEEGWELFEANGKKTTDFFPSGGFVPYVSFNDKHDDKLANKAITNFKKTLCKVAGVTNRACYS